MKGKEMKNFSLKQSLKSPYQLDIVKGNTNNESEFNFIVDDCVVNDDYHKLDVMVNENDKAKR